MVLVTLIAGVVLFSGCGSKSSVGDVEGTSEVGQEVTDSTSKEKTWDDWAKEAEDAGWVEYRHEDEFSIYLPPFVESLSVETFDQDEETIESNYTEGLEVLEDMGITPVFG